MLIIFLCLTIFLPDSPNPGKAADCNLEVSYTTEVIATSGKTRITVRAKGGKQPYYYFFFDAKKNPITWEFQKDQLIAEKNSLPKSIKVLDSEGCFTMIEFNESPSK